jgi:peptide deformylase
MAKLEILTFPDERLRQHARPVETIDDQLCRFIDDMLESMYDAPGIGLAAIQVGVAKQVVVIDVSSERDQPLVLINPEIVSREGSYEMEEGCLSVPGVYDTVTRSKTIRVKTMDCQGQYREFMADDLLAVCIQHELDHLKGKLFVDYLSILKRQRIKHRLQKEQRRRTVQSQSTTLP